MTELATRALASWTGLFDTPAWTDIGACAVPAMLVFIVAFALGARAMMDT